MNEAIRDQIMENCRDPKLRRKFLEKSSEATLTVLQETSRVHEAVNAAFERFKLYVFGREFELETDHKPLQCI